jgi:hypothetical protein
MSRDTEKKIKQSKRADALRGNLLKRKDQKRDRVSGETKKT